MDALVDAHRVHGEGDGQQTVHLLVLFVDLKAGQSGCVKISCSGHQHPRSPALPHHFILIGGPLEHVSRSLDVEQDVGKDANGVLVAAHHQIGKAHIVVGGDLALRHTRVHALEEERQRSRRFWRILHPWSHRVHQVASNPTFLLSSMFSRTLMAW